MIFKKKPSEELKSTDEMKQLVADCGLRHIAFIMDGNGRWAARRGLLREAGHSVGARVFKRTVTTCRDWGIPTVTAYAFSTENWKRPQKEVSEIMRLLDAYIKEAREDNEKNRIRYIFLGDKERLGDELREKCESLEALTADNRLTLNIALNYGGRDEIKNAVRAIAQQVKNGEIQPEDITEETIGAHLYTAHMPDPDLIIRPSGEIRTSNFLLWQSAYSEYYFTDVLWPDFKTSDLDAAIDIFRRTDMLRPWLKRGKTAVSAAYNARKTVFRIDNQNG